jgi:hypothetical protein
MLPLWSSATYGANKITRAAFRAERYLPDNISLPTLNLPHCESQVAIMHSVHRAFISLSVVQS